MKTRNYVKKHQQHTGTGIHVCKHGKYAPRHKQKINYKKEIKKYEY